MNKRDAENAANIYNLGYIIIQWILDNQERTDTFQRWMLSREDITVGDIPSGEPLNIVYDLKMAQAQFLQAAKRAQAVLSIIEAAEMLTGGTDETNVYAGYEFPPPDFS